MTQDSRLKSNPDHINYAGMRCFMVLHANLRNIQTVKHWADHLGVTRSSLSRLLKVYADQTPLELMRRVRYNTLVELIENYPDIKSYAAAQECGLMDEKSLYKFLKKYYGISFTELRHKTLLDLEVRKSFEVNATNGIQSIHYRYR